MLMVQNVGAGSFQVEPVKKHDDRQFWVGMVLLVGGVAGMVYGFTEKNPGAELGGAAATLMSFYVTSDHLKKKYGDDIFNYPIFSMRVALLKFG
jgi:hypothetical protein